MARIKDQRTLPVILIIIAIALVGARIASLTIKPGALAKNGTVAWATFEEAESLARTTKKPVMLYFTADWCAPCHQLDAEVFANASVAAQINERFIPVKVVDRQREEGRNSANVETLQRHYNVSGFPIVQFVDTTTGRPLARMEGFRGVAEFERVMGTASR